MDNGINLLPLFSLLGAAQGIFLAQALLNTQSGNTKAHRKLALFTFLFSIDLGEEFLYQIGFFESVPDLLHVLAPIDLLAKAMLKLNKIACKRTVI